MKWLLDADVLSQPAKKNGDGRVIAWIEKEQDSCYTSASVIAQLAVWVRGKRGQSREKLQAWLTQLISAMSGRVLSFNVSMAHVWADLQDELRRAGQPMPVEDGCIAAIARRHNLTVATGNVADFRRSGIKVFNPFKGDDAPAADEAPGAEDD